MLSSVTVSRNIHRRWPIRAIVGLGVILMACAVVGRGAGDDPPATATPPGYWKRPNLRGV